MWGERHQPVWLGVTPAAAEQLVMLLVPLVVALRLAPLLRWKAQQQQEQQQQQQQEQQQ